MKWVIWEHDGYGGVAYYYRTREEARKHMRRVKNNPFLSSFHCMMACWG